MKSAASIAYTAKSAKARLTTVFLPNPRRGILHSLVLGCREGGREGARGFSPLLLALEQVNLADAHALLVVDRTSRAVLLSVFVTHRLFSKLVVFLLPSCQGCSSRLMIDVMWDGQS